jgi:predicted dehydrogenase
MECGRHVAVEVPAATSVEECWKLVRTAERTKRHCMMLENCIYDTFEAATCNMAADGVFGDIYHAEGGYIHNIPNLNDWRINFNKIRQGDNYPTHGFGPICRVMDIHRTDFLHSITSHRTEFADGSHVISVIRTKKGRSIILQHNIYASRPYSRLYQLNGEKGFAAKYPIERITLLPDTDSWMDEEEMKALIKKYTPAWYGQVRKIFPEGLEAKRFMDYAMDYRLIFCLNNGLPLDMDVYDAAEWSCISELSHQSVSNGSTPVIFPDFLSDVE